MRSRETDDFARKDAWDMIRDRLPEFLCMLFACVVCLAAASRADSSAQADLDFLRFPRFVSPDAFYRPGYMWILNDEMTESVISSQMSDMADMGARTVTPVPEPKEFRPTSMPTLLSPDYLSPGYLDRYRFMAAEAKRLGLNIWLYDEGGWPSGGVCGRLVRANPSLGQQTLNRRSLTPAKGEKVSVPQDCLGAFLYQDSTRIKRLTPGSEETIGIDNARVVMFGVSRSGSYPDLLNPMSTAEFIRMTHERYRGAIGDDFGQSVSLMFTDEPGVPSTPWTDGLAEDFRKAKGYDIADKLPSLFEGDAPDDQLTRIDFHDWWSQRFAEAYLGQIQDWCHRNGFLSGGHLDNEHTTQSAASIHALRALRHCDIPGVDVIWRQVWPGAENHHFPKYASSAAHIEGRPWALTESFAVYGSGLTPEQMKWISDYQYVRGINLMTMIGYPLSTRDWFMGGERPSMGNTNPLWRYMDAYHAYIARLSYLLSLGTPEIRTAVYYPARDIWARAPELGSVITSHDTLARILLENQCDFDLIDDDVLGESTSSADGKLCVGPMRYDTVCVARTLWMTERSKSVLAEFATAGGKVLWADNPAGEKPVGSTAVGLEAVAGHVKPLLRVSSVNPDLRVCCRRMTDGVLYFVTNEGMNETRCTLTIDEQLPLFRLDPETGECYRPSGAERTARGWSVPLTLSFAGSAVLCFTSERLPLSKRPPEPGGVLLTLGDGWSCRQRCTYALGEHDIEVRDVVDDEAVRVALGDWRSALGEGFSGDAEYTIRFECDAGLARAARLLDMGDVRYGCEVRLNGGSLGRRLWRPWSFVIAGKLGEGVNELSVTVTNTLANQYLTSHALDRFDDKHLGPYHKRALEFERESLSSGLFGPVTIRATDRSPR